MYPAGYARRITGTTADEIRYWERASLLGAVDQPGQGCGHHKRYSLMQVLAIAISKALKRHGAGLTIVRAACLAIAAIPEADLRGLITAGRDHLALIGSVALEGLWPAADLADSPTLRRAQAAGEPVTTIDVGAVLAAVDRRIREVAAAP